MNKKDTVIVIGNGPSMKEEYIDIIKSNNIDSIGMNSIYRFLNRINWYPKYYCCFDSRVAGSHKNDFIKLMDNEDNNIKEFVFYQENFNDYDNKRLVKKGSPPRFKNQKYSLVTTGTCAVRYLIEKGYKNIILVGIDVNYKEKVAERSLVKGTRATFKLEETPQNNPNYFFEDYQLKGDIYNIPNRKYHESSWIELLMTIKQNNINLIQTSNNFKMPYIKNIDFNKIVKEIK